MPSVSSINGSLEITVILERAILAINGVTLKTRVFNQTIPGPTIRVRPGDEMKIRFQNLLVDQGSAYVHNQFSAADESNLHFHGLHVSGELPSDDSMVPVLPGEERVYMTLLPQDHMPGTHWLHPHRHGSTALQLAGGAAAALIVEDAPGTLPAQVEGAPEVILVVMQIDLETTARIASRARDSWFSSSGGRLTTLVNGEVAPTIGVRGGEWTRFRIVYAGWLAEVLNFDISGCEKALLAARMLEAKDGIYIRDFPRMLSGYAPIPVGGRADLMVRCMAPHTEYQVTWGAERIATVSTGELIPSSLDLEAWSPRYPAYLEDLQTTETSPDCSCVTELEGRTVNGHLFEEDFILHESYLGAVVERAITARSHPYHQHVYPFQLMSGFENNDRRDNDNRNNNNNIGTSAGNYDLPGDWHDTIEGQGVVRYKPAAFTGKVMLHCHRLDHEDEGMMSIELVKDSGPCVCRSPSLLPTWAIIIIVVVLLLVLGPIIILSYHRWRRLAAPVETRCFYFLRVQRHFWEQIPVIL
ncbi:Multicopper oxidase mco [Durusdinium trenchii]